MSDEIRKEVWPVMLTPFTDEGEVDYFSLERLVEWYEENGVDGLFAVCQSSEMFCLSLEERVRIAKTVCRAAHVPVIASGHVSFGMKDQAEELKRMGDTGVEAVVLITNRFASKEENSQLWKSRIERILDTLPESLPLGLYECPYPYKRLLSDDEVSFCAQSNRFHFLKDTSCDLERICRRLSLVENTPLKLFNANSATLLESLSRGSAGFSGVMANFHPQLYVWLCENWFEFPEEAKRLQAMLTMCSYLEKQLYPVNAKHCLVEQGILKSDFCRVQDRALLSKLFQDELSQVNTLTEATEAILKNWRKRSA